MNSLCFRISLLLVYALPIFCHGRYYGDSNPGYDKEQAAGLFVGVRQFESLAEVPFAVDDAVDLAYAFIYTTHLLLPANVRLCLAGEPQKPESKQRLKELVSVGVQVFDATLPNVLKGLDVQAMRTGPKGLLLVGFACHGFSLKGIHYLAAQETNRVYLSQTSVNVSFVTDTMAKASAKRRLLLVDACRQFVDQDRSLGKGEPMTASFIEAMRGTQGFACLAGATVGGVAHDDRQRRNGVFTSGILAGLEGKANADPEVGFVTLATLAQFVDEWVKNWQTNQGLTRLGISTMIEGAMNALPLATGQVTAPRPVKLPDLMANRRLFRADLETARGFRNDQHDIDLVLSTSRIGETAVARISVTYAGLVQGFGLYGPTTEMLDFGPIQLQVAVSSLDLERGQAVVTVSQIEKKP